MSTTEIKGFAYEPIIVSDAGNVVHIAGNATVISGISGISEQSIDPLALHDNTYVIDGRVLDKGSAISIDGDGDTITVGESGQLLAGTRDLPGTADGIFLTGDANRITNAGEIVGGDFDGGIFARGSVGSHIDNSGLITGGFGIDYQGDKGLVVNEATGIITGKAYALGSDSDEAGNVTLVNHGLVIGSDGIALSSPTETMIVTNDGTIRGDVDFGDGNDRLDTRGGTIKGAINGGIGDDTLVVDDAKYHLTEMADQGFDTVKSTVSYTLTDNVEQLFLIGKAAIDGTGTIGDDDLHGGQGNNALNGLDGSDKLSGGRGDDVFTGGSGGDSFAFRDHFGHDTITDFDASGLDHDRFDISALSSIDSFSDLMKHHVHEQNGDVVIDAGANDTITIEHTAKADLHSGDFIFAA